MSALQNGLDKILNNFRSSGWNDWVDILIVAVAVYALIGLVRRTRAGQLARGAALILAVYALAFYFNLRTLTWILNNVLQVGFLALVVVFQPELRRALEQLGRTDVWMASLFRTHRDDSTVRARWQTATVAICDAAEQLSDTRTGALIVLERNSNLSEIIRTGTPLNGDVNREMLGTIF